jgi:hypothetical protein
MGVYQTLDGALAGHYEERGIQEDRYPAWSKNAQPMIYNHAWVLRDDGTWEFYELTRDYHLFTEISEVELGE